nr:MAG TPA: hypothetical protein [Caudoviricetes sp.]
MIYFQLVPIQSFPSHLQVPNNLALISNPHKNQSNLIQNYNVLFQTISY